MPTPTKIPDPYDRTEWRDGRLLDYATIAVGLAVEVDLGYRLTVLQGVGGAPASSGTHLGRPGKDGKPEGGRAVDVAPWDVHRKTASWREIGGPGWPRDELPGVWGPHGHLLNRFDTAGNERGLAPAAVAQLGKYDRNEDGLAGDSPDRSRLPHPRTVFTLERYRHVMSTIDLDGDPVVQPTRITKIRDALVVEDHDIGEVIAMMRPLKDEDWAAAAIRKLQKDRSHIRTLLERMPKR